MNDLQSALAPAGPQAAHIATLWWVLLTMAALVCLAVAVTLITGIWRGRRSGATATLASRPPEQEQRLARIIAIAVGATALILFFFLVVSVRTGRAIARVTSGNALAVRLIGRQWWWDIVYLDTVPSRRLQTANELHIPVGRPVRLELESRDVIHSFWAPSLTGKRDLIPGHPSSTWFQADTPGVYRAPCAEFCGYQHAKMALWIVAEPESVFARWYETQLRSAPQPVDSVLARGRDVFMTGTCVMCHAIRGTPAGSRVGPDLTHVGSRRSLAAGSIPNVRGYLAAWIVDPQRIKPGVRMPLNLFSPADLEALIRYLESLR